MSYPHASCHMPVLVGTIGSVYSRAVLIAFRVNRFDVLIGRHTLLLLRQHVIIARASAKSWRAE